MRRHGGNNGFSRSRDVHEGENPIAGRNDRSADRRAVAKAVGLKGCLNRFRKAPLRRDLTANNVEKLLQGIEHHTWVLFASFVEHE
jgi:hypothetical protein